MLTREEEKLVKRYYRLPALAIAFLVMALATAPFWGLLVMIGDLVFHGGFSMPGLWVCLALVAANLVAFVACYIMLRRSQRNPVWLGLVERVQATLSQEDYSGQLQLSLGAKAAGVLMGHSRHEKMERMGKGLEVLAAVGTTTAVIQMMRQEKQNARLVARLSGINPPKVKGRVAVVVLAPLCLLTLIHVPQFVASQREVNQKMQTAAVGVYAMEEAFTAGGCAYVYAEDPMESYQSYGYSVTGYLYDLGEPRNARLSVSIQDDGRIAEVSYFIEVDVHQDQEETIRQAKEEQARLNAMLLSSGVEAVAPVLLQERSWPQSFWEAFAAGSYYQELPMEKDQDGVWTAYETDPQAEYDQYSSSYFYLSIDPDVG